MILEADDLWEYKSVANTVPVDPVTETVPSSGWSGPSAGPFGAGASLIAPPAVGTAWAVNTGLWIRRQVVLSGDNGIIISGKVENSLYLYFNGTFVGAQNIANAARSGAQTWHVVIPKADTVAGTNTIALLCLDESGGGDGTTYISVEMNYLPAMLTLQPEAPAKETLAWLTEVQTSNLNFEDRAQLRLNPRQQFEFTYPANMDGPMQKAFNAVYAHKSDPWLVPVWPQGQFLGAVTAGLTTLSANTTQYDLRSNSLAMLWQAHDRWQLVGVDTVGSGSLTISGQTESFTNAWLIPVINGFIPGNSQKRLTGHNAKHTIQFQSEDVAGLSVSSPGTYEAPITALEAQPINWSYLIVAKTDTADYSAPGFDDSAWSVGPGGFGSDVTWSAPAAYGFADHPGTPVANGQKVWMRRKMPLTEIPDTVQLQMFIDEIAIVWVNGVAVFTTGVVLGAAYYTTDIPGSYFKIGDNDIAIMYYDFLSGPPTGNFNWFDSRMVESLDFYTDEGLLSDDSLSDDIVGNLDIHDEDLGVLKHYAPWLNNQVSRTHNVVCETRAEAWALRQWLFRRAGKYRSFWQPSFEADLRHESTGTVTTALLVKEDDFRLNGSPRRNIAVETAAGWFPARIVDTTVIDSDTIQLNLDRALNVAASAILRVCWLGAKRLNTDSITIEWIGGGVCKTEFRLLELHS